MPTFLDNSLGYLNNGWQQVYGQPGVGVSPATPISTPTPQVATPVMVNPNVAGSPDMAAMLPVTQILSGAPIGVPTPIAYNPEVGQPLGAGGDSSGAGLLSGGGSFNLWSWLQSLFGGGQQAGPISTNAPTLNPDTQVGPATPTMPQAPQTTGGVATTSPGIDAANAANTSFGGGGGGGPNIGGSVLGGIGSGLSQMGKGISSAQTTFNPVNLPLPQRIPFTPPTLSPNTKASY